MAKAQITTPSGIKIEVQGTPAEIRAVLDDLEQRQGKLARASRPARISKPPVDRLTLRALLEGLRDEGFFKEPRELSSIKGELEAKGHLWPVTTLSGAVLAQVRIRNLRRLRQNGRWAYVRAG